MHPIQTVDEKKVFTVVLYLEAQIRISAQSQYVKLEMNL